MAWAASASVRSSDRDYPIVFATLFIFSLMGLVVSLISDLIYTMGRSAHRFRKEGCLMSAVIATGEVEKVREPPRNGCSPLNQRRWQNFKANRRGYWSLWIFLVCSSCRLFAEFIANDKPILASYKGETAVPRPRRLSRRKVRRLPCRHRLPLRFHHARRSRPMAG
jgi:hypothetical protein